MPGFEEPILSRLNRIDNILKQLEDIRSANHSPKSSYGSTTSSGTPTSEGHPDLPMEKRCRPLDEVIMEVERKGTLVDRLVHVEDRIFKLCLQLEEEFEARRRKEEQSAMAAAAQKKGSKKGFKKLVEACARGKMKRKNYNG
ncbi:hypothetical protein CDL12_00087 [Handroanthus impetiginosus]|uniref:Uncharacterized protein n=1 Tax=Handroanthus impetiginosus TaxID=429701 RepID=A0A2G9IBN9_9LAMI|nr:hypothetical protein CDL12_00087 [Handroanthus impetiginosus]